MKIIIPEHIKTMVDRIEKEYENLYIKEKSEEQRKNENVYMKIEGTDKIWVNDECYLYFSKSVKRFREELENQDTEFFKNNDEYCLKRKIVSRINNCFSELPVDAYYRTIREIYCEENLEKALKKKKFKKGVREEVIEICNFIKQRQIGSWGQEDAYVDKCIFKYIETEQEFKKILRRKGYEELTPGDIKPFKEIRVAYLEKSKYEIYKEKGIQREFEKILYDSLDSSVDIEVFDMWNNIKRTGIYYVYIPKIVKTK